MQAGEGQGTPVWTCWGGRVQLFPADERALIAMAAVTEANPQIWALPVLPNLGTPRGLL